MEKPGQSTALRAQFSPAVVALTAVRSRRVLSMPDVLKAGFKDSTATVTWIGHFHGAGLPNGQTKSARASSLTGLAPAGVSAQSPRSIPTVPPVQRRDTQRPDPKAAGSRDLAAFLDDSAALLDSARVSAAGEARLFGFVEAADFAGEVEEIARSVEYLQVVAAQAVERTRTEAQQTKPGPSAAAPQWRTGWTEPATDATVPGATVPGAASVLDDGYRNAAQFLRARLRIGIGEAKRRLALAPDVLPQTGMAGQNIPARHEILAQALTTGDLPSRSASIISTALDKVRHLTDEDTLTRMEHALTTTAVETDPDFVTTMAKRWIDAIDHDGPEPTEEILRQLQGVFLRRRRRHGLHHLEIFATDEQYEILTTAMNVATNPRLTTPGTEASPDLDRRSRPQKLLNGLTSACSLAMRTEKLPANGGLPPQLTVTIGYQELLEQVHNHHHNPGTGTGTVAGIGTGTATFTGPMHPNTIRKIACDADILPVLLGSDSRILDIGRTTRIFPPHIRKAITARDQGCAFPDCTMPAPWCEAHHTTYWSNGGTTSTDNGTLLCSHHHLIHKEQWRIDIKTGIPWFIPPPHIDPHQTPRRNHHHTPHRT
ncbi:DUF222 domain-containing protein [Paenarthrobacter sp. AMU7]|uniref:DUF222 domain-containing protein n=1 Tax=Paenarthrobacter sp. AMU7 TaxID=3162492 RepID=A0AB39YT84_9MICC